MEHYKNLTAQQLSMIAACALLVGGILLAQNTILGSCFLLFALGCGIGAYRKTRTR